MKSTLEKRILIFVFLILTLTIATNTGLNIEGFRRDYRDGIILRAQSLASELKTSIEKILAFGIMLEELEGFNVRCRDIVSGDPEIVYCLVENTLGQPLYANEPSFDFTRGSDFIAPIKDSTAIVKFPRWGRVYDVSVPVYRPNGDLAGRIRVGFPDKVLRERTVNALKRSLLILCSALVLVFTVIVLFTKRNLISPIHRLRSVAKEIASGNLKVDVPTMSNRDFGELAIALQEMAGSLQDRERKLQQGYQELEETNRQLQESYERQEAIGVELGRSREMYRSLLDHASDAIVVSDEEDRIVLLNKAAESFFGLPREKTHQLNFFAALQMLRVEDLDAQYEVHQNIRQGRSLETEVSFLRPTDQRRLLAWAKGSPVVGLDGKVMVQTIYRDVTRERQVKENLEKSTWELQRLNQMKDSFLGLASHELKTPLTVIIGYSDLLLGEMGPAMDDEVAPLVQHIGDAAARLSSIVRDMVDVSMLDNKAMPLRSRPCNVNAVIRQALKEIDFFFSVRHQTLVLNLGEQLPDIACDPDRMIQVITNLVVNAIKFTPDGGSIAVETRLTQSLRPPHSVGGAGEVKLKDLGEEFYDYVEILIRDNGIGIAEIDQIHVFDKFYEVGNIEEHFTGKMAFKGKGTGLGLTIVKGIVDAHGGEIWVESSGHDPATCPGSTFHIILPVCPDKGSQGSLPGNTLIECPEWPDGLLQED